MEPLVHFLVPFTALLLVGVGFKKALPVSLLAVLPDFDALFLVHRSVSHSIVLMLIGIAPFLFLAYKFKPRVQSYALLALMAAATHPILDVFGGYTPIFWPLYGYSVWIRAELFAHVGSSLSLISSAQLLTRPVTVQPFQSLDAPLFTGEGLILSAVLLLPVLLKSRRALWQQIKHIVSLR